MSTVDVYKLEPSESPLRKLSEGVSRTRYNPNNDEYLDRKHSVRGKFLESYAPEVTRVKAIFEHSDDAIALDHKPGYVIKNLHTNENLVIKEVVADNELEVKRNYRSFPAHISKDDMFLLLGEVSLEDID
jgi:hypothetical protein